MTGNGLAIAKPRGIALREWDEEFAKLVRTTILKPKGREATNAELAYFAEQVQRTGLDPFLKQIYGIYRKDKRQGGAEILQIQVAIDGFRLIAHRTGLYAGQDGPYWCGPDGQWRDVWLDPKPPAAARVGVWRAGAQAPIWGVARFDAYAQRYDGKLSGLWATMPDNQIAKCAEALALRKGFPAELSGIYTPEEMHQVDSEPVQIMDAEPVDADVMAETVSEEEAQRLAILTFDLEAAEQLRLAASDVAGRDIGDCSTLEAATTALASLTLVEGAAVDAWLTTKAEEVKA